MIIVFRFFIICALFISSSAYGQVASSTGIGTVDYTFAPDSREIGEATDIAKENALDRYVASNLDPNLQAMYQELRDSIMIDLDTYIMSYVELATDRNRDANTFTVTIRADINATLIRNYLIENSRNDNSVVSSDNGLISFLFMSRAESMVQQFDDRVVQRVDTTVNQDGRTESQLRASESENINASSIDIDSASVEQFASQNNESVIIESGGSTTSRADRVEMEVSSSQDINLQMTGILSNAGFEVVEAEFVEEFTDGMLNIEQFRTEFASGDDISARTIAGAARAMQELEIPFFALGTLDVSLPDSDPVTGNARTIVTVTGRVYDLSGRFPRTLSAVGPIQFIGLGPTDAVARNNALINAAQQTANTIVTELSIR